MKKAFMVIGYDPKYYSNYEYMPSWVCSLIGNPNDNEYQNFLVKTFGGPLLFCPIEIRRKTIAVYGGKVIR